MDALGCSNKKAITIMKELDTEAGIGLIEKKRQGQGKPTMIYVKQFVVQDVQKCKNYTSEENMAVPEVKKVHVLKCKKDTLHIAKLNGRIFGAKRSHSVSEQPNCYQSCVI